MKNSTISWTNSTWNPWVGCQKVSSGCKYCYMHRIEEGYNRNPDLARISKGNFNKPLEWIKGRKIFTCSMSDFFIEEADQWRSEAWKIIKNTPQHNYLILTKRSDRIKQNLPEDWSKVNYQNVWLGVTVEMQENVKRIYDLENIDCKVKWVSFEPLIDEVNLNDRHISIIDWAVLGGESGNNTGMYKYRKSELSWFLALMYKLRDSGTPLFFKQFGTWYHYNKFNLKDKKGEKYCSNFPNGFMVRQYPTF